MKTIITGFCVAFCLLLYGTTSAQTKTLDNQLFKYAKKGDLDSVMVFVNKGADVNSYNYKAETPLFIATQNGHYEVVKHLLEHGANPDYTKTEGLTSLMIACYNGDFNTAHILARYSKNLNKRDFYGTSALHYAVYSGELNIIDMLLAYEVNTNIRSKEFNTPLHIAMYMLDTAIVQVLINHGSKINIRNKEGEYPIHIAAQQSNLSAIKVLVNNGADVNVKNSDSMSVLSIALLNNKTEMIDYLLGKVSLSTHSKKDPYNPVNIARKKGLHKDVLHVKSYGYRGSLNPSFGSNMLNLEVSFNDQDIFYSPNISMLDYTNGLLYSFGITSRFQAKTVSMYRKDDIIITKESKFYIEVQARKLIPFFKTKVNANKVGVYGGVGLQFQITTQAVDKNIYFRPQAGFYFQTHDFIITSGYAYTPYPYVNISPHKISLGLCLAIQSNNELQVFPYFPAWL